MIRMWRIPAALLLAVIVSGVTSGPAQGYSLLGPKWPSGIAHLTYYQGIAGPNTADAWSWARTVWNGSPTQFWMVTQASSSSANFRLWQEEAQGSGRDGETITSYSGANITRSDVYLNTYYTNGYTAAKRDSVSAHEFGHGVGLADIYGTAHIVMNGNTPNRCGSPCINTPQGDDNNGVNYLYH
jgi:hypothetical protein